MPTAKRRLAITVSDRASDTLDHLAALQGRPRSAIVAELIDECEPTLRRVAETLEAVRTLPKDAVDRFARSLDAAQGDMEAILFRTRQLELGTLGSSVVEQARRDAERDAQRPARRRGAPDPRPVTRGSTPRPKRTKTG